MNELISIIVPVYNVKDYLTRCISSLLQQTYSKLEIILVDDGSTDDSGKICDQYAFVDKRIKVFHKENGGLSDARNYGINKSSGKYLSFIDSDDYVAPNYIEILYELIKNESVDISICGCQYSFDEYFNKTLVKKDDEKSFSSYEAIIECLNIRLRQSAWGKLYKRELFDSIRFPVGKLYEDLAVVYDLLLKCKRVAYVDAPAYYYSIRQGSIMQSDFNLKQAVEIEIIDDEMDKVISKYNDLQKLTNARRIYSYFLVLRRILLSTNPDEYIEIRKSIRKKIKSKSRGLLFDRTVKKNIKIKILSYMFGEKTYMFCQKMADKKNPEIIR